MIVSTDDLLDGTEPPVDPASLRWLADNLSSCDFVGDSGCCDPECWRCHSPLRPENLRTLAKNLVTAAQLDRSWRLRDTDPTWRPGCNLKTEVSR